MRPVDTAEVMASGPEVMEAGRMTMASTLPIVEVNV